jgi:hypothetical protein
MQLWHVGGGDADTFEWIPDTFEWIPDIFEWIPATVPAVLFTTPDPCLAIFFMFDRGRLHLGG